MQRMICIVLTVLYCSLLCIKRQKKQNDRGLKRARREDVPLSSHMQNVGLWHL